MAIPMASGRNTDTKEKLGGMDPMDATLTGKESRVGFEGQMEREGWKSGFGRRLCDHGWIVLGTQELCRQLKDDVRLQIGPTGSLVTVPAG